MKQRALWIDRHNGIEELNDLLKKGWQVASTTPAPCAMVATGNSESEKPFEAFEGSILVILTESRAVRFQVGKQETDRTPEAIPSQDWGG